MPDNREIVLEALLLNDKGEYADRIIKSILDKYSYLERFERSFINRVFTGTVERKLTLDYIINSFSTVKVNKQKPVIRAILRMSTYQLVFMNSVPDSAAINEAVKLAKKKKFNGLTGFVNGVLRKIAKEKQSIEYPDKDKDFVKYLSVTYSCPEWLCVHFINECGKEKAEKILLNSLVERPVIIRTNISKTNPESLKEMLTEESVTVADPECLKDLTKDDAKDSFIISDFDGLGSLGSFNDGLFCVQDMSSQCVLNPYFSDEVRGKIAEILKTAKTVVDVCAAPGGKTCHVADLLEYYGNKNCKVISRDLTEQKVYKIEDNIERCSFANVNAEEHDALLDDASLHNICDIVIADLPCSGLGVIGRKADIKYRVQEDDLSELANLQRDILKVVSQYVRPGGMLIFSTCTVNKHENEDNAVWIENNLSFDLIEKKQILNDSREHDGFFISWFIKNNG